VNEQPVDLTSLAAAADPDHWDAVIRKTLIELDDTLEERAQSADLFDHLAVWSRPALATAALMSVLAIPFIVSDYRAIDPGTGADGMATVTRIWSTGGPKPNGAQLGGVLERTQP
jgi:hypothetical protein